MQILSLALPLILWVTMGKELSFSSMELPILNQG